MAISKRRTFKDSVLQAAFRTQGYVVVNLDESEKMNRLAEAYRSLYPYNQEGCVFSCHDTDCNRRFKAQNFVRQVIGEKASVFLDNYKFVNSSFVAKYPGENGAIPPHTDFTLVDDRYYSAVSIWVPLTETTAAAGRLHVLPGSHRYTPLCGSNLFRKYTDIKLSSMTEIELEIGQAVCYDPRTIHASPANTSSSPRIAGNCVLIPEEADLWHVTCQDQDILIYAVDDGFYSGLGLTITHKLLSNYRVIHAEHFERFVL
ncbi:phytanoyl-CoA dioxygenase family protein [Cylindrospermopsis raciborskii Cr2010]|uniref:phytanoyl-CoA dioxygenase family protein n=1 Tax=Cylindrospermopsis raciborskii TaxID=77022 RepID=UPI000E1F6F9E|nr:phytanoyl-CoA dioxygenase family protein [Cylindrospermopsis raciborskii]UJL34497.1 phytanoyl-CoA dioxygenase family protein [Cylindrospermopsis raciborskii Cr2010]